MKTDVLLEEAAKLFRERNAIYGDNYLRAGAALHALFPDGIRLSTAHDHNRFQILNLIIVKLSRYCVNWEKGGHKDSIHDNIVYSAMLETIDAKDNGELKLKTADELHQEGRRLHELGGFVAMIHPTIVDRYVEHQIPFLLSTPIEIAENVNELRGG